MKTLVDILCKIQTKKILGNKEVLIKNIQTDSRKIVKNSLFVAIKGTQTDGHLHINECLVKGAVAVVCEHLPNEIKKGVTYIVVANCSTICGELLNNFYNNITQSLTIIGVTGTNGKTSTATMLFELFRKMGNKVGLLSTVENIINKKKIVATHTTPDTVSLYLLLKKMQQAKCEYVFMECSSHAIDQDRIAGIQFKAAVFTNITHDHLDYHKNFKNYIQAKKKLFDHLSNKAFAVSNIDDKRGEVMLQNTKAKKITYSLKKIADYKATIISNEISGVSLKINTQPETHFKLVGEFNAYNLLAVYATACELGKNKTQVLECLSTINSPEGRFNVLVSMQKKIYAIVDYAHTPDAIENVLNTILKIKTKNQNIYTVIGCGGNRDITKRPLMANIVFKKSFQTIFTSDNPRNENPKKIINDMQLGIKEADRKKIKIIQDRQGAIKWALNQAKPNDIVLVAGKGHEDYQDIKGVKHLFIDKQKILECFKNYQL